MLKINIVPQLVDFQRIRLLWLFSLIPCVYLSISNIIAAGDRAFTFEEQSMLLLFVMSTIGCLCYIFSLRFLNQKIWFLIFMGAVFVVIRMMIIGLKLLEFPSFESGFQFFASIIISNCSCVMLYLYTFESDSLWHNPS